MAVSIEYPRNRMSQHYREESDERRGTRREKAEGGWMRAVPDEGMDAWLAKSVGHGPRETGFVLSIILGEQIIGKVLVIKVGRDYWARPIARVLRFIFIESG
jgi:hypothetical protein